MTNTISLEQLDQVRGGDAEGDRAQADCAAGRIPKRVRDAMKTAGVSNFLFNCRQRLRNYRMEGIPELNWD